MAGTIRALVLEQGADKKVTSAIKEVSEDQLPAGDVTVKVDYSTVNYKDGLIVTTGGRLVRTWPHVGGIDLAGFRPSRRSRSPSTTKASIRCSSSSVCRSTAAAFIWTRKKR